MSKESFGHSLWQPWTAFSHACILFSCTVHLLFSTLLLWMGAYLLLVVSDAVSIGLEAQSHGKVPGPCTTVWTRAPAAGVLESSPLSGLELLSFQPHILSLSIPAACLHADCCSSPKTQTAFSYRDELSRAPPISHARVAYLHNELARWIHKYCTAHSFCIIALFNIVVL